MKLSNNLKGAVWLCALSCMAGSVMGMGVAGPPYRLTNLSAQFGAGPIVPSVSYGINDRGLVCGHGHVPQAGETRVQPFFFDPGRGWIANLGDIDGGFDALRGGNGYAINRAGWVAGRNGTSLGMTHAFVWIDTNGNGRRELDEMIDLHDGGPYTYSVAEDVNDAAQVCGSSSATGVATLGWVWTDRNGNGRADAGEKDYLGAAVPVGLNDAGQVALTWQSRAWRWTDFNGDGVMDEAELAGIANSVGGTTVVATDVDRQGRLGGTMKNGNAATLGFFWTDANGDNVADTGEIVVFGNPVVNTFVRGMNDRGALVGGSLGLGTAYGRAAYVWDEINGMRNLNDLIDPYEGAGRGPFYLSQAEAINNRGQIVATGWFDDDYNNKKGSAEADQAILLTPVVAGDLDGNAAVDLADWAVIARHWLETGCLTADACGGADLDGSQAVDNGDLQRWVEQWPMDF